MAKYRVYGNYIFSKILGEYEADTEEKAIKKALNEADCNATLCVHCSQEFVDSGELDEDSCTVDLIDNTALANPYALAEGSVISR